MELYAIAAVDENWGIGKANKLLFSIPEDMKYFRKMTLGAVVISGRNNLMSFPGGKPLPKRRNIILSRTLETSEEYEVVRNRHELFELLKDVKEKIFVIGGGEVYKELIQYCSKAYITKMYRDFNGEIFFPALDDIDGWSLDWESELMEYEGLKYRFTIYKNKGMENSRLENRD